MAFSMHSHSGQFCPGHAKDDLEVVLNTAISQGMQSFSFTEHMPRTSTTDLYPSEVSLDPLWPRHDAFLIEAVRLRDLYSSKIKILIGFEGEWIRPSYASTIEKLAAHPAIDYFIGSVHHVHEIPIDYDKAFYQKALDVSGSEEKLFGDYYDSQHAMLLELKPRVVGHFDLIRLLSSSPDRDPRTWPAVWEKLVRNLRVVVEQGGLLEVNSSGLRKGMREPYPGRSVCEEFLGMGGKLTMSDDSHGVVQVGACFGGVVEYLEGLGVRELWLLERGPGTGDVKVLGVNAVPLGDVKKSLKLFV